MKTFILFLLSFNFISSQEIGDLEKIIDTSLTIKCNYIKKSYNTPSNVDKITKSNDYNNLYLLEKVYLIDENYQPYNLNFKGKAKFYTIDIYSKKNLKTIKKGIIVWKIYYRLYNNNLKVYIVEFNVFYKNKVYNFTNIGGTILNFKYDCNKNKWIFLNHINN